MAANWSSLTIDPRDFERNQIVTPAFDQSASFQTNQSENPVTPYSSFSSWPNAADVQASQMPTAPTGPSMDFGPSEIDLSLDPIEFEFNDVIGAHVDTHRGWSSHAGYEETIHFKQQNASHSSQYPLPLFMFPSYEHDPNQRPQEFNLDSQGLIISKSPAKSPPRHQMDYSVPLPTGPKMKQQPATSSTTISVRSSEQRLSRATIIRKLKSRRRPMAQKRVPTAHDTAQGKHTNSDGASSQSTTSSSQYSTNADGLKAHAPKFQEAIAMVQESIKPFSPPFRRKAAALIDQVAELVMQLNQVAIDEELYGNASSDVEVDTQPSIASSADNYVSNPKITDLESNTDNTSVSSTPRQAIVENETPAFAEDDQQGPNHPPSAQCGAKTLYFCTRQDRKTKKPCRYAHHVLAEWKRHMKTQKHSQRERFMCPECPNSPPAIDINGHAVCQFCEKSFPTLGANLRAHYTQCHSAQRANKSYGRQDKLIDHLRSHPGVINLSLTAAAGRYTVNSEWPDECGFCGKKFSSFDEMLDHIAKHFQAGLNMSSWKLPFQPSKDSHLGFQPHSKGDDSDSDDDMDYSDRYPSHQRSGTPMKEASSFSSSSQSKRSNGNQESGSSYQGDCRRCCPVSQPALDNLAESIGSYASDHATTSVALERYLNDQEQPVELRLSQISSDLSNSSPIFNAAGQMEQRSFKQYERIDIVSFDDRALQNLNHTAFLIRPPREVSKDESAVDAKKEEEPILKLSQYFWVDTCCIDKLDPVELSKAINSMFRWYRNAKKCYVYLAGVSTPSDNGDVKAQLSTWEEAFRSSRWFTRGWTLQELIAPASVEFFSKEGKLLGDKESLEKPIHENTQISVQTLQGNLFSDFSIIKRKLWAAERQTTEEEDRVYCLLGLCEMSMPTIYREGEKAALKRLEMTVKGFSTDEGKPKDLTDNTVSFVVPFDRNLNFTGRGTQLAEIEGQLHVGGRTTKVAVWGLGGVGKTQLVLTLVYRIRDKSRNCAIIWIPATNMESLHQAYLDVARQLKIPGSDEDKADAKTLVQGYLSKESAGRWLLVFDNADDVNMWITRSGLGSTRLIDHLPRSEQGCIVFTARDRKTAFKLGHQNIIEVLEMDEDIAIQSLQKCLVNSDLVNNRPDTAALLRELTYLPLAIVQEAAYINENGIALAGYLAILADQEEEVIDHLGEEFEDSGRYDNIKNPVFTTWLISFEHIRHRDPLAADCLSFMACIDPMEILQSLLPAGASRKKEIDAIGTLDAYSFTLKRAAGVALDLHRLMHFATRNWLRQNDIMAQWSENAITRLEDVFPDDDYQNRTVWRTYLPHVYCALISDEVGNDGNTRIALSRRFGLCLLSDGRYNEAEAPFVEVMERHKRDLEQENIYTLTNKGHSSSVKSVAFSPDGKQVVSGSRDETIRLWDAVIGAALQTLEGHSGNVFQAKQQIDKESKKGSKGLFDKMRKVWGKETKDKVLSSHFGNRDLVFLVDNGATMRQHWDDATILLGVPVNKAMGQDPNGLDLWFTLGNHKLTGIKKTAAFTDVMGHADAVPTDSAATDIGVPLGKIFEKYLKNFENAMTIIVLTDGLWQGVQDKDEVSDQIVTFVKTVRDLTNNVVPRSVSIKFIQFGADAEATARLVDLDDHLKDRGIPDVIDTEPASGDIYKMLFGSLVEDYDDGENGLGLVE